MTALNEISEAERETYSKTVSEVCPHATFLGVLRNIRPWDVRFVVQLPDEDQPSIIRFLGPDVAACPPVHKRLTRFFEEKDKSRTLGSSILDWGEYRRELWYRRAQYDKTLVDVIKDSSFDLEFAKRYARKLINLISRYHNDGLAHGHLSPENIAVLPNENLVLIDAGIGASIIQAAEQLGFADSTPGFERESFAPEIYAGKSIAFISDVFGAGRVIQALVNEAAARASSGRGNNVKIIQESKSLLDICDSLCTEQSDLRPGIGKIKKLLTARPDTNDQSTEPSSESSSEASSADREPQAVAESIDGEAPKKKRRRKRRKKKNRDGAEGGVEAQTEAAVDDAV